jgi:hypothetical protein
MDFNRHSIFAGRLLKGFDVTVRDLQLKVRPSVLRQKWRSMHDIYSKIEYFMSDHVRVTAYGRKLPLPKGRFLSEAVPVKDIDALEDERDVLVSRDTNEADFIVWPVGNLQAGPAKIIDAVLGMLEWEPNGGH